MPERTTTTAHNERGRRAFMAAFGIDDAFLAKLPDRLANRHRRGESDIEAAATARHRDQQFFICSVADMVRHARRFAAEQQDVALGEGEFRVRERRLGRKQNGPPALAAAPVLEAREVEVAGERRHFEIVHAGPLERAIGQVEAGGLDDVDGDTEASSHAQDRSCVAGDIGLVEGDAQVQLHGLLNSGASATHCQDDTKIAFVAVAILREPVYTAAIFNANRRRRIWNS